MISYEEFKAGVATLAATNAMVTIATVDGDGNGILTGTEIDDLYHLVITKAKQWNYSVTDDTWNALKAAGAQANSENAAVVTMLEIAKFQVFAGNVFLN